MTDPVTAAAVGGFTAAAAKAALKNVVRDLYRLASGALKNRVAGWQTDAAVNKIYRQTRKIRHVKTIWQIDKPIDCAKFFVPPCADIGGVRKPISCLADLDTSNPVVVQATLGRGKSILCRYMASVEVIRGSSLPIFVELRLIEGRTLMSFIIDEFAAFGIKIDSDVFDFLASSGKVSLFLDGFDEVPEGHRAALIKELENLVRKNDELRVVVTSRPDSGIEYSSQFDVIRLLPMEGGDYKQIIEKICHSEGLATEIIDGVERRGFGVRTLLTTPLMVALLVVRYRADQEIPENEIAFFSGLFELLLQRHDKTKAGFIRPRKSGMSDSSIHHCFDALCFMTRRKELVGGTRKAFEEISEKALSTCGEDSRLADTFLHDVISITCLLLEEGGSCRYVHKSVQEFHAASFIRRRPDSAAEKFYRSMRDHWHSWDQELKFLSLIDRYRYEKWFAIPDRRAALQLEEGDAVPQDISVGPQRAAELFREIYIDLPTEPGELPGHTMRMSRDGDLRCLRGQLFYGGMGFFLPTTEDVRRIAGNNRIRTRSVPGLKGRLMINVSDCIMAGELVDPFILWMTQFLSELAVELSDAEDFVRREEGTSRLLTVS